MRQTSILSAMSWLSLALVTSAAPAHLNIRAGAPTASSISTIYHFPNGTWLENLAVRENGGILLSDSTSPQLLYLDPFSPNPKPSTIHTFGAPATDLVGIAELGRDIFYVASLNYSFATFTAVRGSGQLWRVDMTAYPKTAPVKLVANLSSVAEPNGITALPASKKILIADNAQGVVWRVDVSSGAVDIAANNSALAGSGGNVNGIHAPGNGFLYFTNSNTSTFGRFPIDPTGTQTGAATTLFQNSAVVLDDFALYPNVSSTATFLMDGFNNRVVYAAGTGSSYTTIANISGATAGAFGRRPGDENSLYVSSTGGHANYTQNPVPVGGALTKVVITGSSYKS